MTNAIFYEKIRQLKAYFLRYMAHKLSGGSTSNGRDSNAKRLGVKKFGGQVVIPGNIILRQRGNKYFPGDNVGQGKDFTLYSTAEGRVRFFEKRQTKFNGRVYRDIFVTVDPAEELVAA